MRLKSIYALLFFAVAPSLCLASPPHAQMLSYRDSCAAVATSLLSGAAASNSIESLERNSISAYLRIGAGNDLMALHQIESTFNRIIAMYGAQILDQVRGSYYTDDLDSLIVATGYSAAFTASTCMAILLEASNSP